MARKQVTLTFPQHLIKEPVVYQLGHKFDIVTNIRRADIQEGIGWVILELEGDDAEIDRGLDWARTVGVRVDPALGDLVEP